MANKTRFFPHKRGEPRETRASHWQPEAAKQRVWLPPAAGGGWQQDMKHNMWPVTLARLRPS